jgi:hypothetical protein
LLIKINNGVADQKNAFADQKNNSADHFTNSLFFLVITLSFTEEIRMHSKHCDPTKIA